MAGSSPTAGDELQPQAPAAPVHLVKAFYFTAFCYLATHLRYLTLYFESEGLHAAEIGTMWSVHRVVMNGLSPLWGALADKTKRARSISLASLIISFLPFMALAWPLGGKQRFWPRAICLWAFGACSSPQSALRDALARAACAQEPERWGKARVYGAVGWGISHLVLGPLMDLLGFAVLFTAFVAASAVLYFIMRASVPEACGEVKAEVTVRAVGGLFLRNRAFFVNMAVLGGGFSMVEGMLFLLLQELHASTLLCGLSVVVTVLFEVPIFHHAKWLLTRLGARRMILVGQVAWVVRALFYSQMRSAWAVLIIEPLHGVTFALVWTAALHHVAEPQVSGRGLEASAQGLLTFCFMGIGPVIGLAVGGWLFDTLGSHTVYVVFAVAVLASGAVYARWDSGGSDDYSAAEVESKMEPSPLGRASPTAEEEPAERERN